MTVEILTRTKGLLNNISPTGVKYVIEPWPKNNALVRIRSVNKTGPEVIDLAGTFTSIARAQTALTSFLNAEWDHAEQHSTRLRKEKAAVNG